MTDTTSDTPDFLPSDDDLRAEIGSQGIMDQPSWNSAKGDPAFLAKLSTLPKTVSALAPADRDVILAEVNKLPMALRPAKEAELVAKHIEAKAVAARMKQGPGDGADAYAKARWSVARNMQDLNTEADRIAIRLGEVTYDEKTGAAISVYPEGSYGRQQMEGRLRDIEIALRDLEGPGGDAILSRAMEKALADKKAYLTDLHVEAETQRRAKAQLVNERIERGVEARTKRLRTSI